MSDRRAQEVTFICPPDALVTDRPLCLTRPMTDDVKELRLVTRSEERPRSRKTDNKSWNDGEDRDYKYSGAAGEERHIREGVTRFQRTN